MRVLFYNVKKYEEVYIDLANKENYHIKKTSEKLNEKTAIMAKGFDAVSIFTNDNANETVINLLASMNVNFITTRAAGFDNIDIKHAHQKNITIANAPDYSPETIAEHTIMLVLSLLKKLKPTLHKVELNDFTINNIIGETLKGKTAGVIGTGKIGSKVIKLLNAFGTKILAYDIKPDFELESKYDIKYVGLETLLNNSDIVTIHTPLDESTHHLINDHLISSMRYNSILINTSRGGVIDTVSLLKHLKTKHLGACGLDVYEFEKDIFFNDYTGKDLKDKMLNELIALENVIITPHQAFATHEAIEKIISTTFYNLRNWQMKKEITNEIGKNTISIPINNEEQKQKAN